MVLAPPRFVGLATAAASSTSPAASGASPMLRHQAQLPSLPVPDLAHTADLYLQSVAPLLTPAQLATTRAVVADFVRPGGLGETLTARLRARAARLAPQSWLLEWWNELAYFGYRDSVVLNVSYFFLFQTPGGAKPPTQTARAAGLVHAALAFRDLILRCGPGSRPACRVGGCSSPVMGGGHACTRTRAMDQGRADAGQGQGRPAGHGPVCVHVQCVAPRAAQFGQGRSPDGGARGWRIYLTAAAGRGRSACYTRRRRTSISRSCERTVSMRCPSSPRAAPPRTRPPRLMGVCPL
jgi:hypothetical protein